MLLKELKKSKCISMRQEFVIKVKYSGKSKSYISLNVIALS